MTPSLKAKITTLLPSWADLKILGEKTMPTCFSLMTVQKQLKVGLT